MLTLSHTAPRLRALAFALLAFCCALPALPTLPALADGVLLSNDIGYPGGLLRNRTTEVRVEVYGVVAVTTVTQTFTNEWSREVDAVYSFPLPAEAHASQLLYTRGDTLFQAVLRVREQSTNPGAGDGGIAALVNEYIGGNGIRLQLEDIPAGGEQSVTIRYIERLDAYAGTLSYRYPLDAGGLIDYPLDVFRVEVRAQSTRPILGADSPSHSGLVGTDDSGERFGAAGSYPKTYLDRDYLLDITTESGLFDVDLYSVNTDTTDGHFALIVRPSDELAAEQQLGRRVVLVVSTSSRMAGAPLQQSVAAAKAAVADLGPSDRFSVLAYGSGVNAWRTSLAEPTDANRASAVNFLDGLAAGGGSRLDIALDRALGYFPDGGGAAGFSDAILAFTDGRSPLDPRAIASANPFGVGIFPIAVGDDIDRDRLEMTARLNRGFLTVLPPDEPVAERLQRVFDLVSRPFLTGTSIAFQDANVASVLPATLPATYAGTALIVTGRYSDSGPATLRLAGQGRGGEQVLSFGLTLSQETTGSSFVRALWASEAIDALEREIAVYGETPALKDSVIALSLRYQIRSRYTAYIADYETIAVGTESEAPREAASAPVALAEAYPNPFTDSVTLRVYVEASSSGAVLRIYDALGRLVAEIALGHLPPGWHEIRFDGRAASGTALPGGVYLARVEAPRFVSKSLRLVLVR